MSMYFSITSSERKSSNEIKKETKAQAACHTHVAGAACGDFQVSGGDQGRDLSAGTSSDIISRMYFVAGQETDAKSKGLND